MKYLCLVYHDPSAADTLACPEHAALAAEARAYDDDLRQRGHFLASHAVEDARASATIRVREGSLCVDDGPCAATKDQLGGYYLIEARDLNEAIRLASRNPAARLGTIEVRPVRERSPR
jgi:hypothetical protein